MSIVRRKPNIRCLSMILWVVLSACCHRGTPPCPAHGARPEITIQPQNSANPRRPGTGCPDCLLSRKAGTNDYWFVGNFSKTWDSSDFLAVTDMTLSVHGTSRAKGQEYSIDLSPEGRHVNTVFWQLIQDMDLAEGTRVTLTYTLDGQSYSENLEIY